MEATVAGGSAGAEGRGEKVKAGCRSGWTGAGVDGLGAASASRAAGMS
jgi:hypothetical protein